MSSLLTEILISLVVIAIIGGIIGWLVRGVHLSHREVDQDQALKDSRDALEEAQAKVGRLESSMKQMNQLRKTERENLEGRIRELEPLFDIVEKRDARIRELTEQLNVAQSDRQAELDKLQFDMSTRALLGDDDESEVGRLQNELRLANRQRESAINRYQNQVRQIEDLENVVREKDRQIEELGERARASEASKGREFEEMAARVATLERELDEKAEQLALLENKKQYEISLLEARAGKAEHQADELRERAIQVEAARNEFLSRENELRQELSALRAELSEKEAALARMAELPRANTRPATIHAVAGAESQAPPASDEAPGLQSLKGIGQATEEKLNSLGIDNLEQIAALDDDAIKRISASMPSFESQLKRYDWIENARRLTGESAPSRINRQSS